MSDNDSSDSDNEQPKAKRAKKTEEEPEVVWRRGPKPNKKRNKFNPIDKDIGTKINASILDEGQIFSEIIGPAVDLAVEMTNLNWKTRSPRTYKRAKRHITKDEMMRFIAVLFMMDLNNLPDKDLYWSSDPLYSNALIKKTMSGKRFRHVMKWLHFCDEKECHKNGLDDRTHNNFDVAYKIRSFTDLLFKQFVKLRNPRQEIALDESMVKFDGRFAHKQTIKGKPIPTGFKYYLLTESKTGYVLNGFLHDREWKVKAAVMQALGGEPAGNFLNQGYHLYMDNYYSGVGLFNELLAQDTYCCGTARKNRTNMPKDIMMSKKPTEEVKKMKRGDMLYRYTDDLTAVTFKDNKTFTIISSLPHVTNDELYLLRRREERKGEWNRVWVKGPQLVQTYCASMGGVDLADQYYAYNKRHYKTYKWYKGLFQRGLRMALVNAYIIKNETFIGEEKNNY